MVHVWPVRATVPRRCAVRARVRRCYARALWTNIDDLHEAVTTLQDASRIARRVMGVSHPLTAAIEVDLKVSRRALARKTPPRGTD